MVIKAIKDDFNVTFLERELERNDVTIASETGNKSYFSLGNGATSSVFFVLISWLFCSWKRRVVVALCF